LVSEKQIIEWVKKNYGEGWAKNFKLAKILYERAHSKKSIYEVINSVNEINAFSDIKEDGNYNIEVVVLDIRKSKYVGCPRCKRKAEKRCAHILKNGIEPKEILMMPLTVTDKSGDVRELVVYVVDGEEYKEFNTGDMLKLELYVRVVDGNVRIYVNGYDVIKRKEDEFEEEYDDDSDIEYEAYDEEVDNMDIIKDILEILNSVKSLGKSPFLGMISRKGISLNDIERYVVYEDATGMYSLSDEGKRFLEEN
jgi:hypothetical protein